VRLLGDVRDRAPVYGSGGFTSYDEEALCRQLVGWAEEGIPRVKMKVGRAPDDDPRRVAAARRALGGGPELMVDANGAYHAAQARALAAAFAREGVTWLEEPVSSDDLDGLRRVRDEAPPGLAIAAGEYGDSPGYFRRMLAAGSVDVLQADATRCLGPTGFLAAGRLAQAFGVPLSAHCAPSLHAHLACAVTPLVHVEWFFDHVRLESRLFEGFVPAKGGFLEPDRTRAGIGIELKEQEAEEYRVVS
jgi:L-alanine-DL-glutamate epimerase-like enolase superfamily enzyme